MPAPDKRIPEDEEIDDEEDGMDAIEYLGAFLQTEEGETVTQVLDKIAKHMENQNKILIKILSALTAAKTT
jgi:ribosomal 50S subunit-associated protein YjgA (DUF615 family)